MHKDNEIFLDPIHYFILAYFLLIRHNLLKQTCKKEGEKHKVQTRLQIGNLSA